MCCMSNVCDGICEWNCALLEKRTQIEMCDCWEFACAWDIRWRPTPNRTEFYNGWAVWVLLTNLKFERLQNFPVVEGMFVTDSAVIDFIIVIYKHAHSCDFTLLIFSFSLFFLKYRKIQGDRTSGCSKLRMSYYTKASEYLSSASYTRLNITV